MSELGSVSIEIPIDDSAPAQARAALEPLRESLPDRDFGDLRLLVSELVVDDLRLDPKTEEREIRLHVAVRDRVVSVELVEGWAQAIREPERPEPGEAGWGLYLAGLLADRWGVEPADGGGRLWLEKRVAAP